MARIVDDSPVELRKALSHHIESLFDLLGGDGDMRATAKQVADLIDSGAEQTVARTSAFLSSARAVHAGLRQAAGSPPVLAKGGESNVGSGVFLSWWKGKAIVVADADANPDEVENAIRMCVAWHYDGDRNAYEAWVKEAKVGLAVTDVPGTQSLKPELSNRRGVIRDQGPKSPGYQAGPGYNAPAPGSSAVAPGYQPPSVSKAEERRTEILRAVEGGYSWLDELLRKSESSEPVVRLLAKEITARIKKASDTRTPALEDPEGQAIYELHRALVGHGSEMTVFEMRQALRKGTNVLTEIEAMTPEAAQKALENPETYSAYRVEHIRRASMGGDVG